MQLDKLCEQFAENVPAYLRKLPPGCLNAELSHARLRLNNSAEAQRAWANLPSQPGPLFRVAHKVPDARPGKNQSIFWGLFKPGTALWKQNVQWLEITPPNAGHQTGFDALVFKAQRPETCPEVRMPDGIILRFQEKNVRDILSSLPTT